MIVRRCENDDKVRGRRAAEVCHVSAPRMIVELNIQHLRDRLTTETDAAKRQTLADLLDQQEAKLSKLLQKADSAER
jgi:hypothetical protein